MNKCINIREISLVLILIIIFSSTVLGADSTLSLSESIRMVLENNVNLKISNIKLKQAEVTYEKETAENFVSNSKSKKLDNRLTLAEAEENYRQSENEVIIDVADKYLKLIQSQINKKVKEKTKEFEKKSLENIKLEVKLGEKQYVKVLEQQSKYNQAVYELQEARNQYDLLLHEFKTQLKLDQAEDVKLDKIKDAKVWKITKEQAVAKGIELNEILELKKEYIGLTKLELKKARAAEMAELDLKDIKCKIELARFSYEKEYEDLLNLIKKRYYALEQSIDILNLRKDQLHQAEEVYRIVKKGKEEEVKTENELLAALINVLTAEYNHQAAVTDYYIKELLLKQAVGLEIRVLIDEDF